MAPPLLSNRLSLRGAIARRRVMVALDVIGCTVVGLFEVSTNLWGIMAYPIYVAGGHIM